MATHSVLDTNTLKSISAPLSPAFSPIYSPSTYDTPKDDNTTPNSPKKKFRFSLRQSKTDLFAEFGATTDYNCKPVTTTPTRINIIIKDADGIIDNKSDINDNNNKDDVKFPDALSPQLNLSLTDIEDDDIVAKYGYRKIRKICKTLQGNMYEGIIIDIKKKNQIPSIDRVVIKQIPKSLHKSSEAIQDDGMRVIVDEDIVKEAMILKYLTKDNKPSGGYMVKFVDFFESSSDYYLIMEYIGKYNLTQFVQQAHQYIQQKKLKVNEWRKIVKFLYWQLVVTVAWMHDDMNCVHQDLTMDNILVRDGTFRQNADGSVSINPNVCLKVGDFGLSEVYSNKIRKVSSIKWGLKDTFEYTSPLAYNEKVYNPKKADSWALGIILFKMSTNHAIYKLPQLDIDNGFKCIVQHQLVKYIKMNKLTKFINNKILKLLYQILNINENDRYSVVDIVKSVWFETYYRKYQVKIDKKSELQKLINLKQYPKMRSFPFYSMNHGYK